MDQLVIQVVDVVFTARSPEIAFLVQVDFAVTVLRGKQSKRANIKLTSIYQERIVYVFLKNACPFLVRC